MREGGKEILSPSCCEHIVAARAASTFCLDHCCVPRREPGAFPLESKCNFRGVRNGRTRSPVRWAPRRPFAFFEGRASIPFRSHSSPDRIVLTFCEPAAQYSRRCRSNRVKGKESAQVEVSHPPVWETIRRLGQDSRCRSSETHCRGRVPLPGGPVAFSEHG